MWLGIDELPVPEKAIRKGLGSYKGFSPKRSPKAIIWPHGEFSLSYPYEEVEAYDKKKESLYWDTLGLSGAAAAAHFVQQCSGILTGQSCPWPRPPKKKYGLKGITSLGRKMVQSGVTMMARKHGQRKLTFATLTVPPLRHHERCLLASQWGELLRQFVQWVNRKLKKQGLPAEVVSVSEIQPKRLRKSGEGYLHLHAVWPNRLEHPSDYSVDVVELRAWWESSVARFAGRDSVPTTQIRVETVTSNVAGYLAKYMSKGGEGLEEYRKDCDDAGVPSQWWNMSKGCRDMVKSAIVACRSVGQRLDSWLQMLWDGDVTVWPGGLHAFSREVGGRVMTIAYYGWLEEYAIERLLAGY